MFDRIKHALDSKDWGVVCGLVVENPVHFFSCFNIRGCRMLGKARLGWLKTYAIARWDAQEYGSTTDFPNLIATVLEKAGY